MSSIIVRAMRPGETAAAAAALAVAFRDDPINRWIGSRPERDRALFETLLRREHGPGSAIDVALDGGDIVGVGIWDPPGHRPSLVSTILAGPALLRILGRDALKGARVNAWLKEHRPSAPHWYLAHLGAVEGGRGIGSALLEHRLAALDGAHKDAYLESSSKRNLPLYERFGFVGAVPLAGPGSCPPVWPMWRAAG